MKKILVLVLVVSLFLGGIIMQGWSTLTTVQYPLRDRMGRDVFQIEGVGWDQGLIFSGTLYTQAPGQGWSYGGYVTDPEFSVRWVTQGIEMGEFYFSHQMCLNVGSPENCVRIKPTNVVPCEDINNLSTCPGRVEYVPGEGELKG